LFAFSVTNNIKANTLLFHIPFTFFVYQFCLWKY